MKQIINFVDKTHFIFSVIYIFLSFRLPTFLIFRHKYAAYLLFIIVLWYFNRTKLSYNGYALFGAVLFPFAYIADYFKYDTLSLYLSSISLLNFIFSIFIVTLDFYQHSLKDLGRRRNN
jgi:hypothetical protein